MTTEEIIAEIEKRLGTLDERAREAVELALQLAEGRLQLRWQGKNPSWDEWQRMSEEERLKVMDELEQRNRKWLEQIRETLGAFWLLVIDGQIVKWGKSPTDFPLPEELEKLCQQLGKIPLWYESNPLIEEGTSWQPTAYASDAYPSLPIVFANGSQKWETTADFDTGAIEVYTSAEMLEQRGVFAFSPVTLWRKGQHLGQLYRYTRIHLHVSLKADDGTEQTTFHPVLCVRNWKQSPFVIVNESRTALVGRSLCLALKPKIVLDFEQKVTNLHW
ncbi:MAG: hypothetical protein RMK89_10430 [Armatimonadota bacterium]|nr:hypothetical protein [Armatimonadota bacterium]MDW8143865.1 hypothetical protein [Armatimonadota bacterium]